MELPATQTCPVMFKEHVQGAQTNIVQIHVFMLVLFTHPSHCLQEGKAKLLRSLHCEALVLGSMSAEAACSLGREVQAALASALPLDQRPCQQATIIPPGSHLHR